MKEEGLNIPESVDDTGFVYRFVAPNPGPMTLDGTNCYVAGRGSAYIIDPGPADDGHLGAIVAWLRSTQRTPVGVLLTHSHSDHAGGADGLARALGIRAVRVEPGDLLSVDDDTLRAIPTPGHSPDGMSFLLEARGILFSGDTILGTGSTAIVPPDGDMTTYIESLGKLLGLSLTLLAPGHGPIVHDPASKIQEYISHRNAREGQLLSAMHVSSCTVSELTDRLYRDTPSALRAWAEGSVAAGLEKLEREHAVHRVGDVWSLLPGETG